MLTLAIHELWHYSACRLVGEQIDRLDITPFGGVMTCKKGSVSHKGAKGVLVHAAGPIGNYVFLLCMDLPVFHHWIAPSFVRSLAFSNASMLFLNLLPILPLDGGQILLCMGYYLFPVRKLIRCLSVLGMIVGSAGIAFSIYGLIVHQLFNCSLFIVCVYLIVYADRGNRVLLAENIYAVIHERLIEARRIRRVAHYCVSPDVALLELIPLLKEGVYVSFFFSDGNEFREITEESFCQAILTTPFITIKDAHRYTHPNEKRPENV